MESSFVGGALKLAGQQRPAPVKLVPDRNLQLEVTSASPHWKATGERASFTLAMPDDVHSLPAGWYEFRACLQAHGGESLTPCLYPSYANGLDGDRQIPLPEPQHDGSIRALVLFKYAVTALLVCPGHGPSRFRISDVGITKVSRFRALRHMLCPVPGSSGGTTARATGFALQTIRQGLSQATDGLYRAYGLRILPAVADDYSSWVARFDAFTPGRIEELHHNAEKLEPDGPLISILLPVYQTPEQWLRRCIESVTNQVYRKWELCIADDASPSSLPARIVQEYAAADGRIRFIRRERNGHISESSNSALELASGGYVALLDHDDELAPNALYELAREINGHPTAGLVYSDEDKIDADGRRFDPYFKPDFDPDLLRSQNYICHLTAIRTDLVRAVGGFRKGFEGSQDHDLILRCTERLDPSDVRHIPRILYHWRAIPGSTALSRDAKDYASSAGARAVSGHLERCHPGAHVEELSHGHYRVRWPLPSKPPKVSLVIPTRDSVHLLKTCVESILGKTTYPNYEIVVVDNRSSDPEALDYLASLAQDGRIQVLRHDASFNYSAINNRAIRHCDGEVIGLINNDIEVISPDWLEELVSHALRPDVGAVGAMLYFPNDTIQHAGVILGVHGIAGHVYAGLPRGYPGHGGRARVTQSLSAVTGACLLARRTVFEEVGGLDEQLAVAFNDIDFCLRLRSAGYRNIWTPFAELYHHESASRGKEDTEEKRRRFAAEIALMESRWTAELLFDPAYNPNLSLKSLACEPSIPPRHPEWTRLRGTAETS